MHRSHDARLTSTSANTCGFSASDQEYEQPQLYYLPNQMDTPKEPQLPQLCEIRVSVADSAPPGHCHWTSGLMLEPGSAQQRIVRHAA